VGVERCPRYHGINRITATIVEPRIWTVWNLSNPTQVLTGLGLLAFSFAVTSGTLRAEEKKVPLTFSGGYEIGKNDFGRPIVLIAAALGVKPEEFRKAFSGVTPSKSGKPSESEARKNKAALMKVLRPLGVTNERLDEVSNYYRYQPQKGQLWKTTEAKGYAVVEDGKVKKVVLTTPGSGYSSPPRVTVEGVEKVTLKPTLILAKDLKKNGAIGSVEVVPAP
jgi:hypothetical protein